LPARFSAMLDPLAAGKGSEGFKSWHSSVSMALRSLGKVLKLLKVLWFVCRGLKSPRKAINSTHIIDKINNSTFQIEFERSIILQEMNISMTSASLYFS
jgi:hypothetical protein